MDIVRRKTQLLSPLHEKVDFSFFQRFSSGLPLRLGMVACLLLIGTVCFGQEICDNGIDDDGDGMVDIYDPDCECTGVDTYQDLTSYIPNPDFEFMSCCPQGVSDMPCCDGWEQGTAATVDYLNTCGFVMPAVITAGLVPFPSGNGAVGGYIYGGWQEYPGVCLNDPLQAGTEYTISFYIGATDIGGNCDPFNMNYPPINITLFGNPGCVFPVNTSDCPTLGDPAWEVLGEVEYTPVAEWMQVEITFTPTTTMTGIMIGGPCVLPNGYGGGNCFPYFVYDNFSLYGGIDLAEIELIDLGLPCESGYTLLADINHSGGTWQWYFNGAALPGQNDPEFQIVNNNFQSGMYAVTYSIPEGCVVDSILVIVPAQDTTEEFVYFCPGDETDCAGETFYFPGVYEVTLIGPSGCDSIVSCIVEEFDLPDVTNLLIDTCGPVVVEVCNEVFTETGIYEIICSDWRGCDSVIMLDLRVMEPEAIVQPPGLLDCDPSAVVVLDGNASSVNPIFGGSTTYFWEGPQGGFAGPIDEPSTLANKPGKYCLVLTHESNGVFCTDSVCVTVVSSVELPGEPVIQGGAPLCLGDTLQLQPASGGGAPPTGFDWHFDPSLNAVILTSDVLQFVPSATGTEVFCLTAYNECGTSDTTCLVISIGVGDTTFSQLQTCNPMLAGVDSIWYQNQYGCDSLAIVERILVSAIEIHLQSTTCDPIQAGTDTVVYQTSQGCDSLVISTLTLLPSSQSNLQLMSCEPSEVGIDTVWHQNQYGCDSLAITTTGLWPSHQINQTLFTCDPAQAGLDTIILTNQFDCDSTLYIERIYSGNYQETNQAIICGSGVNYTDTLLVTSGPCDSLFITNYVYALLDTTWINTSTCDPGQAGVSEVVLVSVSGCDSTIITSTSLLPSDSTLVSGVTCDSAGAIYSVLTLSNQFGCDSVVITDIQYVGIDTLFVQKTSCDPTQAGTVVAVLPGMDCDTIQVTETTWVPFTKSEETIILCGQAGGSSDTTYLINSAGCDSLVIRHYEYASMSSQVEIHGETCAGDQDGRIEITGISGGMAPYEVSLNGGVWQSVTLFEGLVPGSYTVYVRDLNGCVDTLSGLVITLGASLTIDAGPDRMATQGDLIDLSLQTTQSLSQIQWTAQDPLSCPTCTQTTLGPLTINQVVVVTGWTLEGCSDSDALDVIVKPGIDLFIPNSFTPNNDGINDVFSIYGNDQVSRVRNLAIFDRWGNALYARSDLPVNDPSSGWDGTFRDEVMDPGVYIYVVEVELIDGSVRLYKGDVTLTR